MARRRKRDREPEPVEVEAVEHEAAAPVDPRGVLLLDAAADPEAAAREAGTPAVQGVTTMEAAARWRRAKTEARRAGQPAPPLSAFLPDGVEWHGPS